METPIGFTAVTSGWQLTQAINSEPSATPIVQASLAFVAEAGTVVTSSTRAESDGFAESRGQAEGRWRLAQAIDPESSAPPFLQASLAFPDGAGPYIANAARRRADGPGKRRRLATGGLRVRPGSSARTTLVARLRGSKAEFTVESTLPRAQFDWLLSLVDRPNCSVHLEFELPQPLLMTDADGNLSTELASSRFWASRSCGAAGADPWPIEAQRLAAQNELVKATERLRDLVGAVRDAIAGRTAAVPRASDHTAGPAQVSVRPWVQQQADAEDLDSTSPPLEATPGARAATAAPKRTAAVIPAMTDAHDNDELTLLEPESEKATSITLPAWAEQCGVVGATASSTPSEAVHAAEAPKGDDGVSALVQSVSPPEGGETVQSLVPVTLTPERDSAEEASARVPEASVVGALRAVQTAQWRKVGSLPRQAEDSATPKQPLASAKDRPRGGRLFSVSVAKFVRPVVGLSIAVLLALIVGGYWLYSGSVETTSNSETTATRPLPHAAGQPPSEEVATAPDGVAAIPPTGIVESAGTAGSPEALVLDSTSQAPARAASPALPVESAGQHDAATAVRKSSPRSARSSQASERSKSRRRGGTANSRKAPTEAQPAAPTPAIASAAPLVETAAPAPLPAREAPVESAPPAAPEPCSGLRGLKRAQCQSCEDAGPVSRARCERSVKISYCRGNWGDKPDCPWLWTSSEDPLDAVRP